MLYDVAIIGGGIIGCAIARELTRYQLRVILLEKECEVGFGTSKSNSGIIHAGHHSPEGTLKGELEWAGNQLWDDLCDELGFGFIRCGELDVALHEDQLPQLEQLKSRGEKRGVYGLEIWDQERIRAEEPNLSHEIVAALYAPTAGVVNPYEACFALIRSASQNGLETAVENQVQRIIPENHSFTLVIDRRIIQSKFVINAAGLYADQVAAMAGAQDFTIFPRKGEEYLLDKRLKGIVKRIIFPCPTPISKGILVTPTFDGTVMVGPTAHAVESKQDITTTMLGSQEVFEGAQLLVPGISERDCIAEFAGLRAVSETEDFLISTTKLPGFINVAGIQSPGLTASPAIARYVVNLLGDQGLELNLKGTFDPAIPKQLRFSTLPTSEQISLSEQDHRYSHIICRCEQVSEREILDAIRDGAHTLDGIKFRTRAGMGRCQGGFCSWRCMEMLSKELKIPLSAITKRGGEAWIVCKREERIPV